MQLENIQIQLTKNITEHHTAWSHLLANTNFGNYASNFWNVTLKPKYISVDLSNNTFTFHNANFEFDVEVGLSFGDDNSLYSKQISGQGTFQFTYNKTIQLKALTLDEDSKVNHK